MLEFGLQSIISEECSAIRRNNNLLHIRNIIQRLNESEIQYEVSLIYGLPNQTVSSFEQSVNYLIDNKCPAIRAYPLMLLKGTELWKEKKCWGFKEETLGLYNIPVVVESNSFNLRGWQKMRRIAETLGNADRF